MTTLEELRTVKRRHAARLLKMPGVCGLDISTKEPGAPVLVVHLDTDDPQLIDELPKTLEGHPLRFLHTGAVQKLDKRKRP